MCFLQFIAVDLGGTNLRVVAVTLTPTGVSEYVELKETIPDDVMTGHGELLFDFIAGVVKRASPPPGVFV